MVARSELIPFRSSTLHKAIQSPYHLTLNRPAKASACRTPRFHCSGGKGAAQEAEPASFDLPPNTRVTVLRSQPHLLAGGAGTA